MVFVCSRETAFIFREFTYKNTFEMAVRNYTVRYARVEGKNFHL